MTQITHTLGPNGPVIPALGFGAAPIANLYGTISEQQAIETIEYALEQGIRLIDTSPFYGQGLSETRVGLALRGVPRQHFILSTKVGHRIDGQNIDNQGGFDFSHDAVLKSIEASLKRLAVDYLDLVHLHDPDDFEADALNLALPALAQLRDQGVIGAIGAGMNQWPMLARFAEHGGFDCLMLAGRYTLLEQGGLAFLERCQEKRLPILLAGVFNSGILATGATAGVKYQYSNAPSPVLARVAALELACQAFGISLKAAALQFPRAQPSIASLVIGAISPSEIKANLLALSEDIPAAFWLYLKQQGLLDATVPTPQ
jgi:D-threo-aldose 1-dehydrogenase